MLLAESLRPMHGAILIEAPSPVKQWEKAVPPADLSAGSAQADTHRRL